MKCPRLLCAALLIAAPAFARDAPKPKHCAKGQVATTGKATGKPVCFQMSLPPMQPMQPMMPLEANKPPVTKR